MMMMKKKNLKRSEKIRKTRKEELNKNLVLVTGETEGATEGEWINNA